MTWFRDDLIKVKKLQYNDIKYKGVVSLITIEADTVIGCFDGKTEIFDIDSNNKIIPRDDVDIQKSLHIYRHDNKLIAYVPKYKNDYKGIDFMNHSCNPNCYIDNIVIVKAKKIIKPNEELTFDYRISNLADEGSVCWCNTDKKCYF